MADSLERIAASIGAPRPSLLRAVFAGWEELVGPNIAAHAKPQSLRDGVLTVVVDHPAWATSLRLLSADLLRRIEAQGGEVSDVVVKVDLAPRDRLPPPVPSPPGGYPPGEREPRRPRRPSGARLGRDPPRWGR